LDENEGLALKSTVKGIVIKIDNSLDKREKEIIIKEKTFYKEITTMNNKTASMIRDYGMSRVFDGMDFSELVKIDSGKFVFPVNTDDGDFWCEVDFVAKKEDYTPDYDVKKYAEKLANAEAREKDKAQKRAEKSKTAKKN